MDHQGCGFQISALPAAGKPPQQPGRGKKPQYPGILRKNTIHADGATLNKKLPDEFEYAAPDESPVFGIDECIIEAFRLEKKADDGVFDKVHRHTRQPHDKVLCVYECFFHDCFHPDLLPRNNAPFAKGGWGDFPHRFKIPLNHHFIRGTVKQTFI
jgi:hypothetical protein